MSLLTASPHGCGDRHASSELLRINAEAFRHFVLDNPAVVEHVGAAVSSRQAQLEAHRAAGTGPAVGVETRRTSSRASAGSWVGRRVEQLAE
jgi:hypothetical protein